MADELKSCPACGEDAAIVPDEATGAPLVACGVCGLRTGLYQDDASAAAAWNERPMLAVLVARLRAQADSIDALRARAEAAEGERDRLAARLTTIQACANAYRLARKSVYETHEGFEETPGYGAAAEAVLVLHSALTDVALDSWVFHHANALAPSLGEALARLTAAFACEIEAPVAASTDEARGEVEP